MKTKRFIMLISIVMVLFGTVTVNASSGITIDSGKAQDGVVRVSCAGISTKTKVMVEKGATAYYYDLKSKENFFPLQLGKGSYTVSVLENISGTSYMVVAEKSFSADIQEENSVYLSSTQPVLWDADMEAIKLAASLTEGEKDSEKVVQVLHDYIVDNITYDYDKVDKLSPDYTPDIDTVLKAGNGICYDYSVLFAAMVRSKGIPAKLVKGYRAGFEEYHAWNEVCVSGKWVVIDTTYDAWAYKNGTSYKLYKNKNEYQKVKEY